MIYAVASHVGFLKGKEPFGLVTHIINHFKKKKIDYIYLKHSLAGGDQSQLETSFITRIKVATKFHNSNLILRSIEHIVSNFLIIKKITGKRKYCFIGVDPVNSITGIFFKILKFTTKNVFLCADYADNRFKNPILNTIYHFFDKTACDHADEIWCVSSRIIKRRLDQGYNQKKLVLIPNSPVYSSIPKTDYDGNMRLVVVTHFNKSFDIQRLLKILINVNSRITGKKKLQIVIIGYGPEEETILKKIAKSKEKKQVIFLGALDHKKTLTEISKSFLGMALYTNANPWNRYGDSMKAREYVASGIPVIINEIPSTSDDIEKYGAGLVVKQTDSDEKIVNFINKCFADNSFYKKLKRNAFKMGKDFDKERILNNIIKR